MRAGFFHAMFVILCSVVIGFFVFMLVYSLSLDDPTPVDYKTDAAELCLETGADEVEVYYSQIRNVIFYCENLDLEGNSGE